MAILSKADILAANDVQKRLVSVPEWGGDLYVKTISAGERDQYEIFAQGEAPCDIRATLVVLTACDENGELLFDLDDVKALSAKAAGPMNRVFNAATAINGFTGRDVEDLEKN